MKNLDSKYNLFVKKFKLEKNGFTKPVKLVDVLFGFTTTKKWDNKLGQNFYSFIRVFVLDEEINKKKKKKNVRFTLNLSIKKDERYLVITRNDDKLPLDIISKNDYWHDFDKEVFYDKKGKKVKAESILNRLYKLHIKPSQIYKGLFFRIKLKIKRLPFKIIRIIERLFYYLLIIISGEKYIYNVAGNYSKIEKIPKLTDKKETKKISKTFSIFGYPASFWSIMIYSFIHLVFFTIFYFIKFTPTYLKIIFSNSFLIVIYVIFSLGFFEIILPLIIKYLIRIASKYSFILAMKEIKV